MTIRSLAADLGVAPMSIYRHVRDKDDLLDEVADELLRGTWSPPPDTGDWRASIAEEADFLRRLLVAEPAVLYVYLRHPVVSPTAIERMEAILRTLRDAGFAEGAARSAYAAVHTYTIGFAALEASRAGWLPASQAHDSLAVQLAAYSAPQQFNDGLHYLLEGLRKHHLVD